MSHIVVDEFAGLSRADVPCLFSSTRDFRLHGAKGRLVHRKLPRGPKGYAVVAVASTGHEASFLEQDRVALTIPLAGKSEVQVAGRTFVTKPGEIFAIGPSERSSKLIPQSETGLYRSYTIIAPSRHADISNELKWSHRPNSRSYLQLKQSVEFAFDVFSEAPNISSRRLALVEALIEDAFLDALKPPTDNGISEPDAYRHDELVLAAQAYMEANFNESLTTRDIARAIGVGARTLQIAFRKRRRITPKKFLTEVRLRAMRSQLTCPEPLTTVTSAALECGFFHVGRCSYAYREQFGEAPYKTLQRARTSTRSRPSPPSSGSA